MEILIVDSSIQIIERLAEILSEVKNIKTIHRAVSYVQALAIFSNVKPEIVMLDIGLPGNKSVDLLKEIKVANVQTVVIVLSIHEDRLTKEKFTSAGADYFFDKYHEFENLTGTVNSIAANKK